MKNALFSVVNLFFSLVFILFAASASADETATPLGEVVVTATKIAEPAKDVPASVQVITQEDIKNSTARDAGDLIAEAGIGHVHKYPGALTGRIELRGLTTDLMSELKSRVLVLINGHYAGTVNLAEIPVDDIERIEIVKGPASVLYGSSAMGGVINIITKEGKEGIHGSAGVEAGSWEYWKTQAELGGAKGPFDFYLTAGHSGSGDYEARGYGRIDNTGYDGDEAVSGRFGYKLFDSHHISLGFQHWRGWGIGGSGVGYQASPYSHSDKGRDGFDIGYKTGTIDVSYYLVKDRNEYHEIVENGTGNYVYLGKTDTQGTSIQKIFAIGDHRVIVGGQWDRIEADSSRNTGPPYNPSLRYDSYGAFTEGRLSLLNKKLLLSAGLRYDYFKNEILSTAGIKGLNPREENLDHVTERGGLVYKFTDNFRLKGNIGTAFRAPAPDELATDYVSDWGTHYIGNPGLTPEKSTSYDAGIEYSKNLLKSSLTFFHTDFRDKILSYYDGALKAQTFKNVDGATIQGIEANVSYDAGLAAGLNLSIEPFANITYLTRYSSKDGLEIGKYGKTLLYTPRWTGAFGVKAGQERWDARLIANYTGGEKVQDWNPPSYGKDVVDKGGFTVVSLKGAYRPIKAIEISASIENLFDREYGYVLGYPMPARTFWTGLKWLF
jgi:vitamin B12 transporter